MFHPRLLAAAAALTVTISSVAAAQTCLGRPELTVTRSSVGAEGRFTDDVTAYVGRFGLNNNRTFGGVSVGYVSFSGDSDVNATTFGGDIGVERHVGTSQRVHVCPVFALDYQNGPNADPLSTSAIAGNLGVAFGASFPMTPTVSFVPYARAGVLSVRSTSELGNASNSNTETGGVVGLGAGFRFSDILALTPSVSIPVGFDNTNATIALGATVGFRRR